MRQRQARTVLAIAQRSLQAEPAHGVVDGLPEEAAIDAVEVMRRQMRDARERLEIQNLVEVLGQVVDHPLDA